MTDERPRWTISDVLMCVTLLIVLLELADRYRPLWPPRWSVKPAATTQAPQGGG